MAGWPLRALIAVMIETSAVAAISPWMDVGT
jgi:hypothetical protein